MGDKKNLDELRVEDLDYFLRYLDENWPRVRAYINEKYKDW